MDLVALPSKDQDSSLGILLDLAMSMEVQLAEVTKSAFYRHLLPRKGPYTNMLQESWGCFRMKEAEGEIDKI